MNARLLAAKIIFKVTEGQSLSECLSDGISRVKDKRDSAFIQAVCYGVCRHYATLDVLLSYLLQKPMQAKDSDVHALLLVGLYQLKYMRVPEHAAVSETVNATEALNKTWARGFVNAILREYLREREKLETELSEDEEASYAHPAWWISAIRKSWVNDWQSILNANNEHPPFALRVNKAKLTREQYIERNQEKIEGDVIAIAETDQGIVLSEPMDAEHVPGFNLGLITVQDGAAQLAASLLDLKPGLRVLDACAAPGGKLTHILECEPELEVVAVDNDHDRVKLIKQNLQRLEQTANCICEDVENTEGWWDGKPFDRILLDAPCSASGVIRRHPDIKLLRQPTDIAQLKRQQTRILESLWPLLASGGVLVYATCSIFPEENTHVLREFLAKHKDASEEVITAEFGLACEIGRQILPGMHGMDGFYYAKLKKV